MNNILLRSFGAVLLLTSSLNRIASAHAFIDHAEPRVGSQVAQPPAEIRIWFTQKIEKAFSKIEVFDAEGNKVDKKDCHLNADDKTEMIVSVDHLAAGTYKVVWHVVSVDTHRTNGDFKITVKP